MILLSKFAESRGVKQGTVSKYINRHSEMFEGHTEIKGNAMLLDDTAIDILDEVYPLPKPIEVIQDIETIKELSQARKELNDLKDEMVKNAKVVAQAEATIKLLETAEIELDETRTELKNERERADSISEKYAELMAEKAKLETLLDVEKNRRLSFWERLTGQKQDK